MRTNTALWLSAALVVSALVCLRASQDPPLPPRPAPSQEPIFKGGVDIVNIAATVTDAAGHLVSGLTRDDFRVYDNDVLQTVTQFGIDPISLGIVLDASNSMSGDRIRSARSALERLLVEFRDPENEFFLYQFNDTPQLLEGWTSDKRVISRALSRVDPEGSTAIYDAVAAAVRMAATGKHARRAVLLISDGDDRSSRTTPEEVIQLVRATDVAIYAIGIDDTAEQTIQRPLPPQRPQPIPPYPRFPFPGGQRGGRPGVRRQITWGVPQRPSRPLPARPGTTAGVNIRTLRALTDDSGGRTEIVRTSRDLDPATINIAKELSQQYFLGYAAPERDGRVHTIRVEVVNGHYTVRARRSYVAS